MSTPRIVRTLPSFFSDLDAALPQQRTGTGVPSSRDFLILDYEPIREQLATDYHAVTLPFHEPTGVRVYIAPGRLVRAVTILTRLTVDDAVEVFAIEIDRWPPTGYDED